MGSEKRIIVEEMPRAYFNRGYAKILMHLTNHPDLDIPEEMVTSDGFPLGGWLKEVREGLKCGRFDDKKKAMLDALGISCLEENQSWESMYLKAVDYYTRVGKLPEKTGYCTEEGVMLGAWLDRQKRYYVALNNEQQDKLRRLGVV